MYNNPRTNLANVPYEVGGGILKLWNIYFLLLCHYPVLPLMLGWTPAAGVCCSACRPWREW